MNGKPPRRLVHPSTRAFFREGRRIPGYRLADLLHGYIYGRWTYLYIGIGTGEHRLAKAYLAALRLLKRARRALGRSYEPAGTSTTPAKVPAPRPARPSPVSDSYHGKVVPLEAARQLVTVNEPVRIGDLEQVIPYPRARDLILQNPDHLVALECPCRSAREHPCLPMDVCLIVGEPFASFVVEHHPRRARWICQDEAVAILQAEDERGHVHHAFFKDAMLGRFYAICNCCSCCCGAMQAQRFGTPMLASSGYVAQVDESLCIGCGDCREFCQFEALALDGFVSAVDRERCMGCGVCVSKCAQGALSLARAPEKGEPLEIVALMKQVV